MDNTFGIEEALERSVFELLRKKTVSMGYLPDIEEFDIENNDMDISSKAQEDYSKELNNISKSKGFAIEIFNYANQQYYGQKKPPRIVIQTESFLQGQLGLDTTQKYKRDEDGKYRALQSESMLSDFYFNVHLVTNTTLQTRVLHQIMHEAIPRRGYIPWHNNDILKENNNLMVRYINMGDVGWPNEGIIEKVFRYEIPDAHTVDNRILITDIAAINNITVDINNNNNIIDIS